MPTGAVLMKCRCQYPNYINENGDYGVQCHILIIREYADKEFMRSNVCMSCKFPKDHVHRYLMKDMETFPLPSCWKCDCVEEKPLGTLKTLGAILGHAMIN